MCCVVLCCNVTEIYINEATLMSDTAVSQHPRLQSLKHNIKYGGCLNNNFFSLGGGGGGW